MAANAPMLTKAALVDGRPRHRRAARPDRSSALVDELPTVADIISTIMEEAEATLARLEGSTDMTKTEGPGRRGLVHDGRRRAGVARAPRHRDRQLLLPADASRSPATPPRRRRSSRRSTLSRRGRVWSWTTNHYKPPEPYVSPDPFVPYTVVAVELVEEQMVVLGPLAPGADPADLAVGPGGRARARARCTRTTTHEYVVWSWRPV